MSIQDIVLVISGVLSAVAGTGYFAFIFAKSKYQQEVEKLKVEVLQAKKTAETTDIENGIKVVEMYKEALDDLEQRHEKKYGHLEQMSKNIEDLFNQKEQVLLQEIEYHKKQTAMYKKMYEEKLRELNKLKKQNPTK